MTVAPGGIGSTAAACVASGGVGGGNAEFRYQGEPYRNPDSLTRASHFPQL